MAGPGHVPRRRDDAGLRPLREREHHRPLPQGLGVGGGGLPLREGRRRAGPGVHRDRHPARLDGVRDGLLPARELDRPAGLRRQGDRRHLPHSGPHDAEHRGGVALERLRLGEDAGLRRADQQPRRRPADRRLGVDQ
nr:MAG TPA: hypothetical protein [Caudoviricetes sp.]